MAVTGSVLATIAATGLFFRLRFLPDGSSGGDDEIQISVIVPARNEGANLAKLLSSLAKQELRAHEVLVVDDQSEDDTAKVAAEWGARVVSGAKLPRGWYGKPWACHQGAKEARGTWLLFLDADVELEPLALRRLTGVAAMAPTAVISVCPWHRIESSYEELSVFFNLLMLGGIGAFTWRGNRARGIGLFGQSMMLSKELYGRLGGHESVKSQILENLCFSKRCEDLGVTRYCFAGRGGVSMRMFSSGFGEMVQSWAKGFSSGAGIVPPVAMGLSVVWLTGLMMVTLASMLSPLAEEKWMVLGAYLATLPMMVFLFRRVGRFSFLNAVLFPFSLTFYLV
ncbi:MAG: glycosyltransferase family 2 protein, partial [Verrucomicrobiales bacterium]